MRGTVKSILCGTVPFCGFVLAAVAADRPELLAFPFREAVVAGGTYAAGATAGTNFVVSGTISKALAFSGSVPYRVTLSGATISKAAESERRR